MFVRTMQARRPCRIWHSGERSWQIGDFSQRILSSFESEQVARHLSLGQRNPSRTRFACCPRSAGVNKIDSIGENLRELARPSPGLSPYPDRLSIVARSCIFSDEGNTFQDENLGVTFSNVGSGRSLAHMGRS